VKLDFTAEAVANAARRHRALEGKTKMSEVIFEARRRFENGRRQSAPTHWSSQQADALAAVASWQKRRDRPFFYLAGYAGTGKTTLIAEIARRTKGKVLFGAFTGKAAAVMRAKACADAATIDSLIYRAQTQISCAADPPCETPPCNKRRRYLRNRFIGRTLNAESAVAGADLVIIDEVSMVGERMGRDLLLFGTPILVIGDVAQLPPIGDADFFTGREPDFQLTEIHRQALDSPIIKLATCARQGIQLPRGSHGDSAVIDDFSSVKTSEFDQVICGTHRSRHRLNKNIRSALGFGATTPEVGEKVLCLKNNHSKNLHNGTLWTVVESAPRSDGFVSMVVENDDGETVEVIAPEDGFNSFTSNGAELPGQPFAFGYAITCHKAQGSQWRSALIYDESAVFREQRHRWLYTAITRAEERVVVVS
jgi:exodeoxyribonuclease V